MFLALSAHAGTTVVEGQKFEAHFDSGDSRLTLYNAGLLRVGLFFKVYAAGLYLADPTDAGRVLEDVPKRLEIAYLRNIRKADLVGAADEHLASQFKAEQLEPLRERLAQINRLYADVKAGDRYTLTYLPGKGCTLELNGRTLGTIAGADFARVYFDIWLGPGCSRPEFRDALLKRAEPASK